MADNLFLNIYNSNFFSTFGIKWQKHGYFTVARLEWLMEICEAE
jgi:hypothetical protein